ncbi:MAG: CoA-binding protein, partial [Bacteroidales bacterium]|nr:CoA-binding protein [Bacteroidales bacterium]
MKNKTLIIGASIKPERYSYKAAEKLRAHNHE